METLAVGRGWELLREAEDRVRLRVWPTRSRWFRAFVLGWRLGAVILVGVALRLVAPEMELPGFAVGALAFAVIHLWPIVSFWVDGREELTVDPCYISVHVTGTGHDVTDRIGLPDVADLELAPNALRRAFDLPKSTIRFDGGGHSLDFGRDLAHDEARAALAALEEHVAMSTCGATVPGEVGVVRPTVVRRVRRKRKTESLAPAATRPPRVDAAPLHLVVAGAGLIAAIAGAAWWWSDPSARTLSSILAVMGASLAVWFGPRGLGVRWRRRKRHEARAAHPDRPWMWTGDFDRSIDERTAFSRLLHDVSTYMGVAAIAFVCFRPLGVGADAWPMVAAVSVLSGFRIWNVAFAGDSELRWERFDVRAGQRLTARFATSRSGASFETIQFRLRRYEERAGKRVSALSHVVATHEAKYRLPADIPPPGPDEAVLAHFDVPADAPPTDLLGDVPSWWELEVSGQTSCGAYQEHFRAPVFA